MYGNNSVTKDVLVWYLVFPSFHLALHRDLAFLYISVQVKLTRKVRECLQDELLSCHFVVILISYLCDKQPDLECPLD